MPYLGNQHIVGDSVNNFKVLDDISTYTATFDGSASSVVNLITETIKVIDHRFVQGQRVTYNNGGGSNIGNISSGTAYYVITILHIQLNLQHLHQTQQVYQQSI